VIGEKNLSIVLQPFKSIQFSELLPWASRLRTLNVSMGKDINDELKRHLGSEFNLGRGAQGEFILRGTPGGSYYDGSLHFSIDISEKGYRALDELHASRGHQCSRVFSF
jgi:hypothetical protein